MDQIWVIEQVHLAVVGAGSENVGELTIVVVPRQLERSAPVVLRVSLRRPSILLFRPIG